MIEAERNALRTWLTTAPVVPAGLNEPRNPAPKMGRTAKSTIADGTSPYSAKTIQRLRTRFSIQRYGRA